MKQQRSSSQMTLQVGGIVAGVVSILGGIAAFVRAGQPERYFVAGVIMIGSGVLWLICSFLEKFKLTRQRYTMIIAMLGLGLVLGLFSTYLGCENQCICHLQLGYPGRWLLVSDCIAHTPVATSWQTIRTGWEIDFRSLAADVVFWSGAGLMISFIWKRTRVKTTTDATAN